MRAIKGWDLAWWNSGEAQVVHERLHELDKQSVAWCPGRSNLYRPLTFCPSDDVRVVFVGQDPYPNPEFATGLAFSIPEITKYTFSQWPPTLLNLFEEYERDLHYPIPLTGDLSGWARQGVLLWNAYPSCEAYRSMSHAWDEYTYLTKEVVSKVHSGVVVLFGGVAGSFAKYVNDDCRTILVSHPSPRASRSSKHPFIGSRIFTKVNDYLCELEKEPINWRL